MGPGPPRARPGACSLDLSCGIWSAKMLLKHMISPTALGEKSETLLIHPLCVLSNGEVNA